MEIAAKVLIAVIAGMLGTGFVAGLIELYETKRGNTSESQKSAQHSFMTATFFIASAIALFFLLFRKL